MSECFAFLKVVTNYFVTLCELLEIIVLDFSTGLIEFVPKKTTNSINNQQNEFIVYTFT